MILTNCASNTLATVRTAGHPDLSLSGVTSKCGEDLDHGQGCGYNDAAPEPGTGRGRPRSVFRATGSLEWKPVPGLMGTQTFDPAQAARLYSWMRPPSTSCLRTLAPSAGRRSGSGCGSGVFRSRPRWGLASL